MLGGLLILYAFNAIVIYTYTEDIKTALLWPYTLAISVPKGIFNFLQKGGRIDLAPTVELLVVFVLAMASIAMSEGWLGLLITYLFTLSVVNSNIRNLPESLLWPFMVLKFVFGKLFAGIRRIKGR